MTYAQWIEENVSEPYGACREATEAMALAFPELRRVRGHYCCLIWGERSHWWLVAPDGTIVDPTKAQFPSQCGPEAYVEWDETRPEPTGKCPNCGGLAYNGDYCCSPECHTAYVAYCNNPW